MSKKPTKSIVEGETRIYQKYNKGEFKTAYCRRAREYVTQVKEENGNWLCLHNNKFPDKGD